MLRWLIALVVVGGVGLGAFLFVTRPQHSDPASLAMLTGDPARGETVFWAGGCASCHAVPGSTGEAHLVLAGGLAFKTDFGTFHAPNISSHPVQGIGAWTVADLDSALRHGTSPEGEHYYPAFPYTSYTHMTPQDVADLRTFLATLPPSDVPSLPHEVAFPFNQRVLLGGWKMLFLSPAWVVNGDLTAAEQRGRYLVEGVGHCSECHTPRNAIGGRDASRWLAGAPNPDGKGMIPNITPGALKWSEADIAEYLKTGFTPDYNVAGGGIAEVVTNIAHLTDDDRAAMAAYLKKVPAMP